MVLSLRQNVYGSLVGQKDRRQHHHLVANIGRVARTSNDHPRQMQRSEYYNLPQKAGARKRNNLCGLHHQPGRHQTGRQQVQSYRRFPNTNKCFTATIILGFGKPTDGFRPRSGSYDCSITTFTQKRSWTWTEDMDKEFERVKLLLTTNNHGPTVQSQS